MITRNFKLTKMSILTMVIILVLSVATQYLYLKNNI